MARRTRFIIDTGATDGFVDRKLITMSRTPADMPLASRRTVCFDNVLIIEGARGGLYQSFTNNLGQVGVSNWNWWSTGLIKGLVALDRLTEAEGAFHLARMAEARESSSFDCQRRRFKDSATKLGIKLTKAQEKKIAPKVPAPKKK